MKWPTCNAFVSRGSGLGPLLLAAVALAGIEARASHPPDWLVPLINAPASPAKPEASAVVLLRESTFRYLPDGKVLQSVRQAVRVEALEGAALAGIQSAFNADNDRVQKAQAWIVAPRGDRTEAYGRDDFFDFVAQVDPNYWNDSRVIAFTPGNRVSVGGIVATELEIERRTGLNDSSWSCLDRRPVMKNVVEFIPLPGRRLIHAATSSLIPGPIPGKTPDSLRWEMDDLPAMPGNLPPGFLANPKLVFVRCPGADSLAGRMETWGQFAELAAKVVEPRMIAAPSVVAQAQTLVRGKTDRWERIRALGENVQKQIDYLSVTLDKDSLAGYRPHLPEEVLRNHLGDCKDKSTLLVTMLRSFGEKAFPVLVRASYVRKARPDWPSPIFNHMVVGILADASVPARWPIIDAGSLGKLVIFDPTDPFVPLGILPYGDQGALGLVVADGSQDLVTLPSEDPDACGIVRHLAGEVAANGDLSASVDEVFLGGRASAVHADRARLGDDKFRQILEARFHTALPLLSDLSWTNEWTPADARDHLTFAFKGPRAMRQLGHDALLVCPRVVTGDYPFHPWKKDWEGAVWLPALGITDEVRLQMPEGFTADGLPSDVHQELPFVTASLSYKLDGRTLVYSRHYLRKACLLAKADYDSIYLFHRKLDEAERRPAIIRRSTQPPPPVPSASR